MDQILSLQQKLLEMMTPSIPSIPPPPPRPLTFQEMRKLHGDVMKLAPVDQLRLVTMIKEKGGKMGGENEEDVELDLELLPPTILREIQVWLR
jgi:hypothetical protein